VILIATGSEVIVALNARDLLQARQVKTRVVSMPCCEFFALQDPAYRHSVITPGTRLRVSIEAGVSFGWERWVGEDGLMISLDRFGASAPYETLMKEFGFTAENVAQKVLERLE
jgi:transketolase